MTEVAHQILRGAQLGFIDIPAFTGGELPLN
ncbi:MAG: hypothetical protein UX94_C0017G0003 [Parcubacteria group bacterium GW2011_GWA2_47_21]|nr:MAG: hypothetical protein UW71_C0033G0010 [Parcubacteria group bacterium GW2011_GWB1_44_7]KKU69752.1 MAG: hypothetical protein UX94_C0017G0003 [Parcubacteria group bacterium GW2011_GWA2_47_21]